jgi:hypothetical protein
MVFGLYILNFTKSLLFNIIYIIKFKESWVFKTFMVYYKI